MSYQVDSTTIIEAWVVTTPQAVDTIGFFDNRLNHLRFVIREIIWNVEHNIADQVSYGWDSVCGDIIEREVVRRVPWLARCLRCWFRTNIFERQR